MSCCCCCCCCCVCASEDLAGPGGRTSGSHDALWSDLVAAGLAMGPAPPESGAGLWPEDEPFAVLEAALADAQDPDLVIWREESELEAALPETEESQVELWRAESGGSVVGAAPVCSGESELWLPESEDPELEAALEVWLFGAETS